MKFDERPEAGDEWTAKAMLMGVVLKLDYFTTATLWVAHIPGQTKNFYGVTQARACRKLVRSITGVEE